MHFPISPATAVTPLILATLGFVSGCAFFPHVVDVTDTGSPSYKMLEINYELEAGEGALASKAFRPDDHVDVAGYSGWPSPKKRNYSAAGLRIEYPHPQRRRNFARVTLRLSSKSELTAKKRRGFVGRMRSGIRLISWRGDEKKNPSETVEFHVLDLSKTELDLLLFDLANSGFFDGQQRPSGGSQLSVYIDRGRTAHPWGSEPRLDDLVVRVYKDGRDASSSAKKSATNVRGSR